MTDHPFPDPPFVSIVTSRESGNRRAQGRIERGSLYGITDVRNAGRDWFIPL
jgi:hypothetical protein